MKISGPEGEKSPWPASASNSYLLLKADGWVLHGIVALTAQVKPVLPEDEGTQPDSAGPVSERGFLRGTECCCCCCDPLSAL